MFWSQACFLIWASSSLVAGQESRYCSVDEIPPTYDIYAWGAQRSIISDVLSEGEGHDDIEAPQGSRFTSFRVHPTLEQELPVFITEDYEQDRLEHIFIVIHGRLRDGDAYWTTMNEAITAARGNGSFDLAENVAVIAPQFLSAVYNSGQYTAQQLAWGEVNAWQAGSVATHPARTTLSSFDALDGLISGFTNRTQYPQLNNVTVVGHGGGGQLVQRYAAVGADFSRDVHVRYVHGDASSCAYFTQDRPYVDYDGLIEPKCEFNNTWRYGYDGYTRADGTVENIQQYFLQYVTRDVVSLVGYQDEAASGDESCMARAQGGRRRRDRNLIWYRYVNTLAGTDEDLSGLPGEFRQLTDWSEVASNSSNLRLVVVQGADHNLERLLQDDTAQRAMFNDWDIGVGWRPAD
ncbi:hypothetical protein S7711_10834 [Stachybotrys chartarum IBT 7711]|uniref:Carboxylic ester hydrolase n=1 Tax=Stachybotrys chartarum (strain CBS 109288 / IBT 7711) TaxID=1280523 RepID=A0A084B5J9_STACB|nr:hypothetical protein S7711_10834 [Stachybotrys chartarum IBT 7711]KFA53368.1 hypothetical protein S40293_11094 [Stachybotrys chartarum IBT 40293]KFA73445.1 hypothetical protein S40288_10893 [Stachybotrys chartarum IBT 40288]